MSVDEHRSGLGQRPETTVLGDPEEPPIDGALFSVDMMLDDRDENEE